MVGLDVKEAKMKANVLSFILCSIGGAGNGIAAALLCFVMIL